MPANRFNGNTDYGVGIGLRIPHYNHIFEKKPVVDWFEIISENFMIDGGRPLKVLDQILERYRIVQHGVSMYFGSAEPLNREHLRRLKTLVKRTKTPWLTDHLCWGSVDGRYSHDLLPMPYTFEAAKKTAQKIREARDFLEVPIAVENVSSYAEYHVSEMTEWEFLNEVVEDADCGILLDVNNIYVSSQNHNFNPLDYINNVPHERVAQIHIAGHSKYEKYILDTHDHAVIDPVWRLYSRAIELVGPTATLLEWDDRIPSFEEVHAEALKAQKICSGENRGGIMNLEQLQREVFDVIRQPLTASERMRKHTLDGRSTKEIVEKLIKPNDRLTSVERLEIYNRVYWFRILSSLADDFPGLRAVVGQRNFDKLITAYLTELPSESFTLRNLGSRLEAWLRDNPKFTPKTERLALDMVRLEWADIDAFDSAELPKVAAGDLENLGEDPVLPLQPYLRLLDLAYPVDDMLLEVRRQNQEPEGDSDTASNIVIMEHAEKSPNKRVPLPKPKKVYLAVHRQENEVYFKRLQPEAFALLVALQQGKHLSEAIEASVNWTNQKVEFITVRLHDWFANWASLGWFCRQNLEREFD
jgi:uncharacterized protein (UPF0276 family)